MSCQNVGAKVSQRLFDRLHGGYNHHVRNVNEFKNFACDFNYHVCGTDAQNLVYKMKERVKHVNNFSFEYKIDDKKLDAIFWVVETSKLHDKEFGDL